MPSITNEYAIYTVRTVMPNCTVRTVMPKKWSIYAKWQMAMIIKWQMSKTVNDDWAICNQYRVWINMPSMMSTHAICNLRIRMPMEWMNI